MERKDLFEQWAPRYDETVSGGSFPFMGYETVLEKIVLKAAPLPGGRVLDVGTGTANLAQRFVEQKCAVWGIDFSEQMLVLARQKLPGCVFLRADLNGELPEDLPGDFSAVVSAYVLHEFVLEKKVEILRRLARQLVPDGCMVIGDISFPTRAEREAAHRRWMGDWDESEYYWAADEAAEALSGTGFQLAYEQVSPCAGIYTIKIAG